ncbi:MAG: type II secretion system protein [Planctomycetota bacterium]|jgi:prepilin-type N-terminal cleavage/methylation domain-containing protein
MRTHSKNRVRRAFTLIEILIVVVILGILAAIVIPQFTDASQEAMASNLQSQLQTIRSQIELHNVQNPATLFNPLVPGGAQAWDQLVLNDYLQSPPKNPLQNGSVTVAAAPAANVGWVWADPLGYGISIYAVDETGAYFDGDGDGNPD